MSRNVWERFRRRYVVSEGRRRAYEWRGGRSRKGLKGRDVVTNRILPSDFEPTSRDMARDIGVTKGTKQKAENRNSEVRCQRAD